MAIMANVGTVTIDIEANVSKFTDAVKTTNKRLDSLEQRVNQAKQTLLSLGATAVGIIGVGEAFSFAIEQARDFVKTASDFEQYANRLSAFYKVNGEVEREMQRIVNFSTKYNNNIMDTMEALTMMKVYGINPTNKSLEIFTNTAIGSGKSLSQFVEAMADAFQGENERLVEFGVKGAIEGKKIQYAWADSTGKSRKVVIDNNKELIQSTLETIFNEKYVGQLKLRADSWIGTTTAITNDWILFKKNFMNDDIFKNLDDKVLSLYNGAKSFFGFISEKSSSLITIALSLTAVAGASAIATSSLFLLSKSPIFILTAGVVELAKVIGSDLTLKIAETVAVAWGLNRVIVALRASMIATSATAIIPMTMGLGALGRQFVLGTVLTRSFSVALRAIPILLIAEGIVQLIKLMGNAIDKHREFNALAQAGAKQYAIDNKPVNTMSKALKQNVKDLGETSRALYHFKKAKADALKNPALKNNKNLLKALDDSIIATSKNMDNLNAKFRALTKGAISKGYKIGTTGDPKKRIISKEEQDAKNASALMLKKYSGEIDSLKNKKEGAKTEKKAEINRERELLDVLKQQIEASDLYYKKRVAKEQGDILKTSLLTPEQETSFNLEAKREHLKLLKSEIDALQQVIKLNLKSKKRYENDKLKLEVQLEEEINTFLKDRLLILKEIDDSNNNIIGGFARQEKELDDKFKNYGVWVKTLATSDKEKYNEYFEKLNKLADFEKLKLQTAKKAFENGLKIDYFAVMNPQSIEKIKLEFENKFNDLQLKFTPYRSKESIENIRKKLEQNMNTSIDISKNQTRIEFLGYLDTKEAKKEIELLEKTNLMLKLRIDGKFTEEELLKIQASINKKFNDGFGATLEKIFSDFSANINSNISSLTTHFANINIKDGETIQSIVGEELESTAKNFQNSLKNSGNAYAMAIGYGLDVINMALADTMDAFQNMKVNVGADNKSLVNAMDSVKNSMFPLLDVNRKMNKHLESMDNNFNNIAIAIAKSGDYDYTGADVNTQIKYNSTFGIGALSSKIPVLGGIVDGALKSIFGSSRTTVLKSGLIFGKQLIDDFLKGVNVKAYTDTQKTKKAFFGLVNSTSYNTSYKAVKDSLKTEFQNALGSGINAIMLAGESLNISTAQMENIKKSLSVNLGKFDFKDKTQTEIAEILNGAFGNALSDFTAKIIPQIGEFKETNEDYFTTLARVATGYNDAREALKNMGFGIVEFTNIANKTGDITLETIRSSILNFDKEMMSVSKSLTGIGSILSNLGGNAEEFITAYKNLKEIQAKLRVTQSLSSEVTKDMIMGAGGDIEGLKQAQEDYIANYYTDLERSKIAISLLNTQFKNLNVTLPTSRDGFRALLESLDLTSANGQYLYGSLLKLQDEFRRLTEAQEELTQKTKEFFDRIYAIKTDFLDWKNTFG
ncbi:MAG: hypothetical protein IE878_00385, partial [Epsilonproteobacteria bacterium]|nr:hypothetical protein [Campylobacterota bacterium]